MRSDIGHELATPSTAVDTLILRGEDGAIYAIPWTILEQCQVPAAADDAEVAGYLFAAFPPDPVRAATFQVLGFGAFPPESNHGLAGVPAQPDTWRSCLSTEPSVSGDRQRALTEAT